MVIGCCCLYFDKNIISRQNNDDDVWNFGGGIYINHSWVKSNYPFHLLLDCISDYHIDTSWSSCPGTSIHNRYGEIGQYMGQKFQNNFPLKYDITLFVKHFVVQGLIVEAEPMLRFQESPFHECRHSFLYSSIPLIQLAKVPAISM